MDNFVDNFTVEFRVNGKDVCISTAVGERLSESLRERIGAKDVKVGCNAGDCGSCTVLLNGLPICSCLTPVQQAQGCKIETLSGLLEDETTQRLAHSFQDMGAAQCGICTPGMMVASTALLRHSPSPSQEQVEEALSGVLCRCTGYQKITAAVMSAGNGKCPSQKSIVTGIGKSIRRVDGEMKVLGHEQFGDDIAGADCLSMRIIRSPYPRATFKFGDLQKFLAQTDGICEVLTAEDIKGLNRFGVIPGYIDQPVFAEEEVRFRGESVAAIIGNRSEISNFDIDDFPVHWNPLPSVERIDATGLETAPLVHPERKFNQMCSGFVRRGDPESALDSADYVVEDEFETSFVEHAYIEPEAGFARLVEGRVEILSGTQAPAYNLDSLALILNKDVSDIRILPTAIGGGFGSKIDLSVQPYLALATIKTGQPVRLAYSRTESMQSTTKRHPARIRMKIGATKEGKLSGITYDGTFNTGAYASWGPTVINRVPVHASGPYFVKDYFAQSRAVHTHSPPAGAFRGFGVPQTGIAQESLFDELAILLKQDPLEFRINNVLADGLPTVCGQVFQKGVGIGDCLRSLRPAWSDAKIRVEEFNIQASEKNLNLRRGYGVASGWYGCGNTSLPNPSTIKAGIRPDGKIILHQGAVDIGQGSNTVISQIFAESIGISVDHLCRVGADTDITPDAGKTSASRQTFVTGNAAKLCGETLRRELFRLCNASNDAEIHIEDETITIRDGETEHCLDLQRMDVDSNGYVLCVSESYDPPTAPLDENGQGEPYAQYGYAAQMCEIEVDISLGTVRVLKFTAAHDVGRAINPMLVEGQIEGGIAQGLGMALMEEYVPGRTENLHDYLVPTIGDIPPVESIIIEVPDGVGPYGAKGLGEHALIPTAPAILNAIRNACGARITRVPATPDRVLKAIQDLND